MIGLPLSLMAQTTAHLEEVTVNVETPGTLGDLILQQTENLTDVVTLHLGGTINDADLITLQQRLTRMRHLDALKLQMTEMPERFLYDNDTLRTIVLPASLKVIGQYAFAYCQSLTNAPLPDGLESLGNFAFYNCNSLCEVHIPSTLSIIPAYAFSNTYELESLTIPEGVTEISEYAFSSAFWRDMSSSGHKQIRLTMPSTLRRIAKNAFESNRNIVEVTLNEGLESLEENCFSYAAIKAVTIPSTVSHVRTAFYGCDNLTRITCLPLVPPANQDYNLVKDRTTAEVTGCTLVVPAATINEYKQTLGYDHFAAYEAIDYIPSAITINRDFRLTVPANAPQIDVAMSQDKSGNYSPTSDLRGMGTLRLEGSNTLNVGKLSMFYEFRNGDWANKYALEYDTDSPWGTNPDMNPERKKAYTSIIASAPWTVNQAEQTINLPENRWIFISPLFDMKVGDIQILDELGGHFVVYEYDSQQRAAANLNDAWHKLSSGNTMQAGHGYIVQGAGYYKDYYGIKSKGASLYFPSKSGGSMGTLCSTDDVTIPLTDYPAELAYNKGWNFVGNPYPCYFNGDYVDFNPPIIVWNSSSNRYHAIRLKDDIYVFSPMEAFFVQISDVATEIVFHKEGRQLSLAIEKDALQAPRRAATPGRKLYNVLLRNGDDYDRTRFVINADAKMDYEADKDAAYMPSLSDNVSCIYTCQGGTRYAINERPEGEGLIDLGLSLATDGTYTLSLNTHETDEVTLIDRQEGTAVLLDADGYTFSAKAGTVEGRFQIQLGNATAVQSVAATQQHTEQAIYNLLGQRVTNASKGVFIQNGRKVVIK